MSSLDLRVGALSITGTPGTTKTLVTTWTDSDGSAYSLVGSAVSLWLGGTVTDPTDTTGATEAAGVIDTNTATFTFTVPDDRVHLRMTLDGALVTLGHVRPSLRGAENPTDEVGVNVGAAQLAVTLDGAVALAARVADLEAKAVTEGALDIHA